MRRDRWPLVLKITLLAQGVLLILVGIAHGQQRSTPKLKRWHKYVNNRYGFSFWYPDVYEPVSLTASEDAGAYRSYEEGLVVLARRDNPDARIWVILDLRPFNLNTISHSHSPTGWDPEWIPPGGRMGTHIFYRYGAGGGGVEYPDQFFVNLRGKTLGFIFDGLYQGKSPDEETHKLQPNILKTFRVR